MQKKTWMARTSSAITKGENALACLPEDAFWTSHGARAGAALAPLLAAPHLIGGAYCRPPLVHSALRPRFIFKGVLSPMLRSNISP